MPPAACPSCAQPLTEQGNSRELLLHQRRLPGADRAAADPLGLARRRRHRGVGPVWIERLNEAGLLERPSDFYALERETLLEFDRIADVSADRMIESIDRSRGVGLRRALIGLAIPMASEGTADAALPRRLRPASRRSPTPARRRCSRSRTSARRSPRACTRTSTARRTRAELVRLRELGVDLDVRDEDLPPEVASDAPLAGKTVVITGSIADPRSGEKIPRPAFQRLCERAGATTASSVSASTDMLICGAERRREQDRQGREARGRGRRPGGVWRLLIDAGVA